jgi:putative hydrolase of the HAD superfamily
VQRAVLFDLDDTLFDHRRSAREALRQVHRVHAAGFDFDAFEHQHARYLEEMHVEVLAGRVGLDDARRERFRRVFAALGVALAPDVADAVASAYREGYMTSRRALDGAAELLAVLKPAARIAIVTNNLLDEQQDKLEYCGLAPFVDVLVASEDVGISKPARGIFEIALARTGVTAGSAVMVGDSWANDIEGARGAGIAAVWFNPEHLPRPSNEDGVAEIDALTPAPEIARVLLERLP